MPKRAHFAASNLSHSPRYVTDSSDFPLPCERKRKSFIIFKMKPEVQTILELQEFDLKIDWIQKRKVEIPQEIQEIKREIEDLLNQRVTLREALKKKELEAAKLETDLEVAEETLRKFRIQLNEVKTNEEYRKALEQIHHQEQRIQEIEERAYQALEEVERLKHELPQKEREIDEAIEHLKFRVKELEEEFQQLGDEYLQYASQREARRKRIPERILMKYQKLRELRGGRVIVPVMGQVCGGCQAELPPQQILDLKTSGDLGVCEICGRFLYVPEEVLHS